MLSRQTVELCHEILKSTSLPLGHPNFIEVAPKYVQAMIELEYELNLREPPPLTAEDYAADPSLLPYKQATANGGDALVNPPTPDVLQRPSDNDLTGGPLH